MYFQTKLALSLLMTVKQEEIWIWDQMASNIWGKVHAQLGLGSLGKGDAAKSLIGQPCLSGNTYRFTEGKIVHKSQFSFLS